MLFVIGFFGSIINGIEFAAAEPSTNKVKIITDSMYMDDCNDVLIVAQTFLIQLKFLVIITTSIMI